MSNTDKGILIFREWAEIMLDMPAEEFKEFFKAIYNYQMYRAAPPELTGISKMLGRIVFPCIDRRLASAAGGKKSASQRAASSCDLQGDLQNDLSSPPSSPTPSVSPSSPSSPPLSDPASKEKNNTEEKNTEEYSTLKEEEKSKEKNSIFIASELSNASRAPADTVFGYKKCFGKYHNVFLSEEEYREVRDAIPCADDYIDTFSEKLYTHGYRYVDHLKAILEWWNRDRDHFKSSSNELPTGMGCPSQYNNDYWSDFFDAACASSLDGIGC